MHLFRKAAGKPSASGHGVGAGPFGF